MERSLPRHRTTYCKPLSFIYILMGCTASKFFFSGVNEEDGELFTSPS